MAHELQWLSCRRAVSAASWPFVQLPPYVVHVYPFRVPEQEPERAWCAGQSALSHVWQANLSVVPLQLPVRYLPAAQLMLAQGLQVCGV